VLPPAGMMAILKHSLLVLPGRLEHKKFFSSASREKRAA